MTDKLGPLESALRQGGPRPVLGVVRLAIATAINGRRRNEDAIGVGGWVLVADHPGPLELSVPVGPGRPAVVALTDGMGGHAAGDTAARIAADQLTRSVPRSSEGLVEVFCRADDAIREAASGERTGMGCTAAVVFVYDSGQVIIANLGDVRAYRVVDGYLGQVTIDDRPQEAPGSPPTGSVTRWLGGQRRSVVEPHLCELTARPGDRFLVCTDGLYDVVSLSAHHGLATGIACSTAQNLVHSAVINNGDNATVVVLDVASHSVEDGLAGLSGEARNDQSEFPPDVVVNLSGIVAPTAPDP